MAKAEQQVMVMDEHKPKVSITQIRKVAEYAARADWHFRRGNPMSAASLLGRAREVLIGCELPEEGPIRDIFVYVAEPPKEIRLDDLEKLVNDSMLALEQSEQVFLKIARGK